MGFGQSEWLPVYASMHPLSELTLGFTAICAGIGTRIINSAMLLDHPVSRIDRCIFQSLISSQKTKAGSGVALTPLLRKESISGRSTT